MSGDDHASALHAALELIENQRRFAAAVLDTVDIGLVMLDQDGTYQAINRKHADFMELAFPDGHAGKAGQLGEVYAEDGVRLLERHEMPTARATAGEEFDDIRLWVGADPLTRRAVSVSSRVVRDDKGELVGAALAYKDVTDYLRMMQVKDDFIALVSHEFRTPLTSINGYVSLMLEHEEALDEVQLRSLRVIARNTERLHRLVSDLLQTAQADNQPLDIVRSATDVSEIVRGAVESAMPAAEAKGLVLELDAPSDFVVMVDAQRFAQVVDNLVSNAVKYTPSGGKVLVELCAHDEFFELNVSDTGIGIDDADQSRLFTAFFRSPQAEEQHIQGVGLGLAITRKIVESHGGRIEVSSRPGSGSTFTVRLPVEVAGVGDQ